MSFPFLPGKVLPGKVLLGNVLLGAYGLLWRTAKPLLRRHTRLAEGFEERLVPEGWPWARGPRLRAKPLIPEAEAPPSPCIWIQAASGGEAWLASSLVHALAAHPALAGDALTILCTTCTRQGLDILEKLAASFPEAPAQPSGSTPFPVQGAFEAAATPPCQPTARVRGGNLPLREQGGAPPASSPRLTVLPRYLPLDSPALMERAVGLAAPKVIVLLETELWPGLLAAAKKFTVPVLVLNGRMTEKSLAGYRLIGSFWRAHAPERVLAISEEDATRFAALFGLKRNEREQGGREQNTAARNTPAQADTAGQETPPGVEGREPPCRGEPGVRVPGAGRVVCMPNIKFDRVAADSARSGVTDARAGSGVTPPTLLVALASVREEEEALLLPAIKSLHGSCPQGFLVRFAIAPRHMHRVAAWQNRLAACGLAVALRSEQTPRERGASGSEFATEAQGGPGAEPALLAGGLCPDERPRVLLWDTFGELRRLYAMADVVFVGGSLVEALGGQNFLEPPAQGVVPCIGPHIKHFLWVGEELFHTGLVRRFAVGENLEAVLRQELDRRLAALQGSREASLRVEEHGAVAPAGGAPVPCAANSAAGALACTAGWQAARTREALAVTTRFAGWLRPRTGGSALAADAVVRALRGSGAG